MRKGTRRGNTAIAAVGKCLSLPASIAPPGTSTALTPDSLDRGVKRHQAEIALAMTAHGDARLVQFLVAHDQHVRHLGELRLADLAADRLRALVQRGAYARAAQLAVHARGVLVVAICDR